MSQLDDISRRLRNLGRPRSVEGQGQTCHVPLQAQWVTGVYAYTRGQAGGRAAELVSYLRVRMDMILHHQYGIADHFTITEGEYENWQAVRPRALSDPFPFAYGEPPLVGGPAVVRFDRRNEKLWYGADGPVRAYTYIPESLPPGTYQLEIPGFRHVLGGARYGRHAMAWFRIGRNPTRFLHTGTLTSGCVTVTWFGRWPDIFRYLMTHRMDSRSVGTIRIFDGRTTREDLRWLAEDRERW